MDIFRFRTLAWLLLGQVCAASAAAQIVVNIDAKSSSVATYSGQGAYADSGNNYWNAVTSTAGGSGFLASDGTTVTTISFSVSGIPSNQIGYGGVPNFAGGVAGGLLLRHRNRSGDVHRQRHSRP